MAPGDPETEVTASLRVRLGPGDVRYGDRLVPGAKVVESFGDLETEIAVISTDPDGRGRVHDPPILAARASATIVSAGRDRLERGPP